MSHTLIKIVGLLLLLQVTHTCNGAHLPVFTLGRFVAAYCGCMGVSDSPKPTRGISLNWDALQIVSGTSSFYVGVRGISAYRPGVNIGFRHERRLKNGVISVSNYTDNDMFMRTFSGLIIGCVWACVADKLAGYSARSVSPTDMHYFGTLMAAYVAGAMLGHGFYKFSESSAGQQLAERMPYKKTAALALFGAASAGLIWYRSR